MRADLRTPALGLVAWAAALLVLGLPHWLCGGLLGLGLLAVLARRQRRLPVRTQVGWLVAGAAVAASALLHVESVGVTPVRDLAADRAAVQGTLVVRSDPVLGRGRTRFVHFRAVLEDLTARGRRVRLRTPVVVIADPRWADLRLGTRLRVSGRLDRSTGPELAAVLIARGPPTVVASPGPLLAAVDHVRAGIRRAVAPQPPGPRALVPALVDGDDGGLADDLAADFRTAGLTHLLAVSGTNLTLIVGFLLVMARWCGVRAYGLVAVGVIGVVGFVLLARTEPSVLRAAVMGSVALLGLGPRGRERGARALGVAVLVLLLVDPWLARSAGFALSVCATAGILVLAPPWRDALGHWLPRWAAEAVAVPLAAQLACTPLVAAISGQVSLVAVGANLAVAWAVGPATVLGLVGGVLAVAWAPLGQVVAAPAGWSAAWIIAVARTSAALPVAAIGWTADWASVALLTLLCGAAALVLADVLARRGLVVGFCGVLVVATLVPLPTPGWPPRGWVLVACDIGQGDGLVLNLGGHSAVVVDTGPDPHLMDLCLDRLGVRVVPIVVITHFHADHVDGLAGVLSGRRVGQIETSPVADPAGGSRLVESIARRAGVPVRAVTYGETTTIGPLRWQVLGPVRTEYPDSDSPPNDASVVMLVDVRGVRLLLMGDEERPSQADLRRTTTGLRADVLKVAHHGSSKQDADLVEGLGARLAVISVGVDNDYGHPAPSTLQLLRDARMQVRRTDLDGDVAVVVDEEGRLRSASRMPRVRPVPGGRTSGTGHVP
ncbi:ComEC/Rec2 family competence protein [Nocardioides pocheonensis]|uniref:ComEC/Rec2 family competence protein n=1 Tax=Nocardioides pocheonensis TaxID=661485 RepID=A0A3N0GN10_9ACTN|nr:ComEC/Rec2 family competence protein [Nocardioides pocheonensis]RNM13844.1 ComEC/Rec2 family competence protein [Nocardioides pocheonensis]